MDKHPTAAPSISVYQDALMSITRTQSLNEKLGLIHREIKNHVPSIDRVAVAIYEEERDLIKTFIASSDVPTPLEFYQTTLQSSHSLSAIARNGETRVVNDLAVFAQIGKQHTRRIAQSGYASSYTVPFYNDGHFAGFIFINSQQPGVFTEAVCHGLSPFVHLIGLLVLREMDLVQVLFGSVSSALDISHHRDPETGAHLQRMCRYARLIANEIAPRRGLDDEYVEYIYRFAPLHDVGKIAIPDRILLKPGKLEDAEYAEMKTHARKGREIVDRMLTNFRLQSLKHTAMLRNIVEFHHEAVDGSGYPNGLRGEDIPLEARITAVADVFDALTSVRPYKTAWTNDKAFAELERISGSKLDADCVAALLGNRRLVEEIQRTFVDDPFG